MKLELDGKSKTKHNAKALIGALRNLTDNLEAPEQDGIRSLLLTLEERFIGAKIYRLTLPFDIETPLRTIEGFSSILPKGHGEEISQAVDRLRSALELRDKRLDLNIP